MGACDEIYNVRPETFRSHWRLFSAAARADGSEVCRALGEAPDGSDPVSVLAAIVAATARAHDAALAREDTCAPARLVFDTDGQTWTLTWHAGGRSRVVWRFEHGYLHGASSRVTVEIRQRADGTPVIDGAGHAAWETAERDHWRWEAAMAAA